jgi:hypothetical protein
LKTTEVAKPRCLGDDREYTEAQARLLQLNEGLKNVAQQLERVTNLVNSDSAARQFSSRGCLPFGRKFTDGDIDGFTARAAKEGSISEGLIADMKAGAPVHHPDDFNCSGKLMMEFEDLSRQRDIFNRAISLVTKELKLRKTAAIKAICEGGRLDRERIAKAIANSLLGLSIALREENAFASRAGLQELGLQADVRPRPFPLEFPWEQSLLPWISEALGISEAEARSKAGFAAPDIERRRRDLDRLDQSAAARG